MSDILSQFQLIVYFQRGGIWMYPLLLCSILALAVVIYKAWAFSRLRPRDDLLPKLEEKIKGGDVEGAASVCDAVGGPAAPVVKAQLQAHRRGREAVREAAAEAGAHQIAAYETYLPVLSTVANVAPLLGFLGTVWGMIKAFNAISQLGVSAEAVARGVSEALITTAAGLIIAIPSLAAYNFLVSRVNAWGMEMERAATHTLNLLWEEGEQRVAA